jgi:hypothetical protein
LESQTPLAGVEFGRSPEPPQQFNFLAAAMQSQFERPGVDEAYGHSTSSPSVSLRYSPIGSSTKI